MHEILSKKTAKYRAETGQCQLSSLPLFSLVLTERGLVCQKAAQCQEAEQRWGPQRQHYIPRQPENGGYYLTLSSNVEDRALEGWSNLSKVFVSSCQSH